MKSANELFEAVAQVRAEQLALLGVDGRIPSRGTAKRKRFDGLSELESRLLMEWAVADQSERKAAA